MTVSASPILPTSIFLTHGGNQLGISVSPVSPVIYISKPAACGMGPLWVLQSLESRPRSSPHESQRLFGSTHLCDATQVPANAGSVSKASFTPTPSPAAFSALEWAGTLSPGGPDHAAV